MEPDLLRLEHVVKHFPVKAGFWGGPSGSVHAVDGVTLSVREGDTYGLVGESGCGKTTLARLIAKLEDSNGGKILFGGKDISQISGRELRGYRREVQMIFQDPFESLNPRRTIEGTLGQAFLNHRVASGSGVKPLVIELLNTVGLRPGEHYLRRFPHQFSGGQRQRIGIARAIALRPRLVIADEPVSALDISIRAQILELLKELQQTLRMSCLFISHDLSVVRSLCNVVGVMYLGKLVETAESDELFLRPLHPYTLALLSATPIPDPRRAASKKRILMKGDIASPVDPPSGCRFRTRCPYQQPFCGEKEPLLVEYYPGHRAACHRVADVSKMTGSAR